MALSTSTSDPQLRLSSRSDSCILFAIDLISVSCDIDMIEQIWFFEILINIPLKFIWASIFQMTMSRWIVLLVAWVCCQISSVLTFNGPLSQLEENLLYNHLQTSAHLNAFYKTLLESNGIDDVTRLHHTMTDEDIRQLHVEDKVRNCSREEKHSQITANLGVRGLVFQIGGWYASGIECEPSHTQK